MTELKVEFPVKLNGVFITEDVHYALAELQTGGTLGWDIPNYDNGGITDINEHVAELNNYFIGVIAQVSLTESTEREKEMLSHLYWLRDRINYCKVPEEFITNK